jgi:hypothetical protein
MAASLRSPEQAPSPLLEGGVRGERMGAARVEHKARCYVARSRSAQVLVLATTRLDFARLEAFGSS